MDKPSKMYSVPIWLSRWTFKDKRNKNHILDNFIVKGKDKGSIFTDKKIVDKAVKKLIGHKKKHTLVPLNLTLISQHGYGVDDNLKK